METINARVEFVQIQNEVAEQDNQIQELMDLELALVGGGTGDVII
jgi:hypothetical protein